MTMRLIDLLLTWWGCWRFSLGSAIEWLCVEPWRAPDEPGPPMFTVSVLERLPRVTGFVVAFILSRGYSGRTQLAVEAEALQAGVDASAASVHSAFSV